MLSINWKKTIIVTLDVLIAAYLVAAVTEFNKLDDKAAVCTEVNIDIADSPLDGFLHTSEVKRLLQQNRLYPLGQPLQFVSTRDIEELLVKSPFIDQVQCYKTQGGHISIKLVQRLPVMHIMAANGENYYLDDHGSILPPTRLTSNLVVATGNISHSYARQYLADIANAVMADEFWQRQIVQLNVLDDGTLEMIPRVGDHVAFLGQPVNIMAKLERLRKFYKYGLCHAGWNRYERISVEYDNQIICKRRNVKKL